MRCSQLFGVARLTTPVLGLAGLLFFHNRPHFLRKPKLGAQPEVAAKQANSVLAQQLGTSHLK
jgi:hypothetical protein